MGDKNQEAKIEKINKEITGCNNSKKTYENLKTDLEYIIEMLENAKTNIKSADETLKEAYSSEDEKNMKKIKKVKEIKEEIKEKIKLIKNKIIPEVNEKVKNIDNQITAKNNEMKNM